MHYTVVPKFGRLVQNGSSHCNHVLEDVNKCGHKLANDLKWRYTYTARIEVYLKFTSTY